MSDALWSAHSIVYAAGAFQVLGLLIINQVALRLMLLVGTVLYICYYSVVASAPLWDAIYISTLIGSANLVGILGLLARRSRLAIPRAHRDIYALFPGLPPGDFRTLMHHAKRYSVSAPMQLTCENAPVTRLFFVISGSTSISKMGETFEMPSGAFVGEVGYLTQQNASASSVANEGAELLEWSSADLRRASLKSTRFKMAFDATLSVDMARKVAYSIGPPVRRRGHSDEVSSLSRP